MKRNDIEVYKLRFLGSVKFIYNFANMKAVSIKELKDELSNLTPSELRELCLHLARFKKENKELLTYLLFESSDETLYIDSIKKEIDEQVVLMNRSSYYLIKKSFRKILRTIRRYSRYSKKKETEVELLLYFCNIIKNFSPSIHRNSGLQNFYTRQLDAIKKKILVLHEDLQFDFGEELQKLIHLREGDGE
jgi:hypothetical protein